uniref:Uncharacterized protein n=1 Tax=Leersia perrieri TaxID=77586 RepID=A0A0D9WJN7_9ORYZ
MLGRKKVSSSRLSEPINTTVTTDNGQEVAASHFISQASQLDEAARERLHRMNQRLKMLEMQMETLEAGVAKASSDTFE